ncbi:MAG: T9SS type A sorting domain-containing protein [Ignavibacteria bacterium]|nr:T9SS type A sorting domain-containing protein [Ignavibacteria bacterium]
MKAFKNYFLVSLFFVFTSNQISYAECPPCNYSQALLSIGKENSKFLWYFTFYNIFDSVFVKATFGEFYVENNGQLEKVYLNIEPMFATSDWKIIGQEPTGEDTILTRLTKTKPFIFQPNSKLMFYRQLTAGISCTSNPPKETNANYGENTPFWVGFPNVILDTSEWVLQLVDAQNNQVLFVLDSVGISTNHSSIFANVYGTNPKRIMQERSLPNEFAGREVYLRISTRRFGPTPLGMWLYAYPSKFSLSTFYEHNESSCIIPWFKCNFDYQIFETLYFNKLLEFLDSLAISENRSIRFDDLPPHNYWVNRQLFDSLYSRYFDKLYIEDSFYVWMERDDAQSFRKTPSENIINANNENFQVFYEPKTKSINLIATKSIENCNINIYNLLGKKILNFKNFDIHQGSNTISFPNGQRQMVILQITDSDQKNLFVSKILVY